jgi:hypothetical protein
MIVEPVAFRIDSAAMSKGPPPSAELDDALDDLEALLKNTDVGASLAQRGVNVSLALTLADGLRAYLHGDKERALLELGTATEEIAARRAWTSGKAPS